MIRGFKDKRTEAIFKGQQPKGFPPDLFKAARRKLETINAASTLSDLRRPVGNKLHPLTRDRAGQYAIRINDQFRVCFRWTKTGPDEVEITDYH
jgi:toxin HigB-1